RLDLVAGGAAYRGTRRGPVLFGEPAPLGLPAAVLAAADFEGDGRTDLAAVGEDGILRRLRNEGPEVPGAAPGHVLALGLLGVKNLKLAAGAEVEVKAGSSYQKLAYRGVPLLFGLGAHGEADTVRITWPNGLIQNEPRQPATADRGSPKVFKEAQRLSGPCPMIFAWDGNRFRFITDVLGVAPLGASSGDGEYFPVDHDEYIQIPGEALPPAPPPPGASRFGSRPGGGPDAGQGASRFEIRITEEL